MARITCFVDTPTLANQLQQMFEQGDHCVQILSASTLNKGLRDQVQAFAPDLVLMELAQSIDNPHIFFFLRSDRVTRMTPIIVFSNSLKLADEARVLGADAHMPRTFGVVQFRSQIKKLLGQKYSAYAA